MYRLSIFSDSKKLVFPSLRPSVQTFRCSDVGRISHAFAFPNRKPKRKKA